MFKSPTNCGFTSGLTSRIAQDCSWLRQGENISFTAEIIWSFGKYGRNLPMENTIRLQSFGDKLPLSNACCKNEF
jgi:hypothetical protein